MGDVVADTSSNMDLEDTSTCYSRRVEGKVTQVRSNCGFEVLILLRLAVTCCAQLFLSCISKFVYYQERVFWGWFVFIFLLW